MFQNVINKTTEKDTAEITKKVSDYVLLCFLL